MKPFSESNFYPGGEESAVSILDLFSGDAESFSYFRGGAWTNHMDIAVLVAFARMNFEALSAICSVPGLWASG
jgi:hypothetical protein